MPRTVRRTPATLIAFALTVTSFALLPAAADPNVPTLRLSPVATGLSKPVNMATRPGDDTLYIVEGTGRIRAVRGGVVDPQPVLDISSSVSGGLEQGLLGLAFDPASPDHFYIHYTDTAGTSRIVEYQMDGATADTSTRRELLAVAQPFANHNCGTLRFGPDGYLYICMGDGGSSGDPGNRAQNLQQLLGKMLRIDPRGGSPYGIPADNPFVNDPNARDEIWAYGLRNPWGFSFDRATGDMWIGDVGQNLWEEIDFQPASSTGGENYGWPLMEGTHPYNNRQEPANHTPPIFDYPHGLGCSITGGFVYRGDDIEGAQGQYIFGDYCGSRVWTLGTVEGEILPVPLETGAVAAQMTNFGEDNDGELYVMDLAGNVFKIVALNAI